MMGKGLEWAVRCMLFTAWSAGNNSASEAFTIVAKPPPHPTTTTAALRGTTFVCASPAATFYPRRAPPAHGSSRSGSNGEFSWHSKSSTEITAARSTPTRLVLGHRARATGVEGSSTSSRRRQSPLRPLFSADQGWLDALKEMSGDSGLPMGPKKVGTLLPVLLLISVLLGCGITRMCQSWDKKVRDASCAARIIITL